LQEGELEPLGSSRTRKVDVRVLASTNRDLAEMVSSREFRADLFYRLNVFPIVLPTLQERVSDIPLLARHFVEKHSRRLHRSPLKFDAKTLQVLQAYPWPGNVRELENIVERALLLSSGEYVTLPHLPVVAPEMTTDTPEKLEDYDRSAILHALRESKGRISGSDGAAARLGIKRTTLNSKMKKLGITRFDY
jgi:formate hydrogenlyase transcriptional activator